MKDQNNIPFYSMGYYSLPDVRNGLLYHYTNFDALLKILRSMSLKPSKFSRLNDLCEGQLHMADFEKMFSIKEEFNKCSILCFSRDYERDGTTNEGTNHPRSWSQYGENCHGACIVIRLEDFLNINKEKLEKLEFYSIDKVDYASYNFSNEFENLDSDDEKLSSIEFIKKHNKDLFFKKHIDWNDEDETRILLCGLTEGETLSIDGAIDSICLGARLLEDEKCMVQLVKALSCRRNKCYKKFIPNSFSTISPSYSGYMTDGTLACSKINETIGDNDRWKKGLSTI